jgi:hypothetical protein
MKINNFNTGMAIFSALNNVYVTKQKKAWQRVHPATNDSIKTVHLT